VGQALSEVENIYETERVGLLQDNGGI